MTDSRNPSNNAFLPRGTLPPPGWTGRAVRLVLGAAILGWLLPDLVRSLPGLLALDAPPTNPGSIGFWIALALAFVSVNYVVGLGLARDWGRWPQLVSAAWFAAAVLADLALFGRFWAPPLGVALFAWLLAVYVPLGVAFVLAAALGTPGCEMRAYAHLVARLGGREAAEHFCPGGVDFADGWGSREPAPPGSP